MSGISPDGSILTAGTGGSLVTSAGTWTFASSVSSQGYASILLNGNPAANGAAAELEVANQGHLYAGAGGKWWVWSGSGWAASTAPASGGPVTTPAALTVAENAAATTIGIAAPSDPNYAAAQLSVKVTALPSDGSVVLSDGSTKVAVGQSLSVAQLTGLEFVPTTGVFSQSSSFGYTVSDPAGLSAAGSATLAIGAGSGNSPDGSILTAGTGGSLVTSAGTWTFAANVSSQGYASILLNGSPAANGAAAELEVANQGHLYAGAGGKWWVWSGSGWTASTAPASGGPVTTPAALTVAENAAATTIGIAAPSDPNYAAAQLSVKVTALPSDGSVVLSDGSTKVAVGQSLSVAQLTGLEFVPTTGVFSQSSSFGYTVSDPAGLSAAGSATLAIGAGSGNSPDGSILTAGTGGSLVTSAGTWTFAANVSSQGYASILLNGSPAANGAAAELEVANQGHLYAGAGGKWWVWSGSGWTASTAPASGGPVTTPAALTVAENAAATTIGIAAPSDPNYAAAQLSVKVTALPSDGSVVLSDGSTKVAVGQSLSVAQLTGLEFVPTTGVFSESSSFGYTVSDPAGLSAAGSATLAIGAASGSPGALSATPAFLTVAENAAMAPIGIQAPTDASYTASQLTVSITALPADGTVFLSNGATPVTVGESLTVAQLTGLEFAPASGAYSRTSPFAYTVLDPSGASANSTATLTIASDSQGRILTVGPGKQYATLAAAIAASQNGDTIAVQAGTYVDDFAQINTSITIEGVGGMAVLEANENIPNGKAILVTDANVTINNIEFTGATVADRNGAGIRYESGDLILNDDYFYANQEGLLAANNPTGNLVINNSEFASNGDGSGSTHNIYIGGDINSLTINNSYFHDAVVGHEIKSRAANTYIYNSRVFDGPTGSASYSVDLPNGGNAVLQNNVIQQGPYSQNPTMIEYGVEGLIYSSNSLQLTGNTLVNDLTSHVPLGVWNTDGSMTAQLVNTQIYGLTAGQVAAGPNTQVNDAFLSTRPTLDTSHPWLASS